MLETAKWPFARDVAVQLLRRQVDEDILFKHCLASEAIMRALARRLGEDEDLWGTAGLLHDLDFQTTRNSPEKHTLEAVPVLRQLGMPEEAVNAVMAHNAENLGLERKTGLDFALTCAETVTGLLVAAALVQPDKRLASVKLKSVRKRMKEKAFARNVDREAIMLCEKIGVPLDEFIELSLGAMQSISGELGL